MRRFCLFIGLLLSTLAGSASQANLHKEQYWQDFRNIFPNPYQTIGFAQFRDHSQLYIISEPPADVTLEQIEDVFGWLLYDIECKKWEYGVDGWVKDVLVTVSQAPDSCETEIIRQLNHLLYGYSDQILFLSLPVKKRELFLKNSLDVCIHAASLYAWFIEENMPMEDFMGNPISFKQICSQAKNAVYRSHEPGFVVWTLPRGGAIGTKDMNARKFTLNSDIIIGAIASSNTVSIIARERETDLLDVPPLRTEEVALLAWAPNELNQSLDIGGLITGKMSDNYDWCPAYLCDELNNTELGHLLTITDVFMKDWLDGATYEYNQYHYPKPTVLFTEDLGSAGGVHFNWNTEGLYHQTNYYPYSVFSIRNTGCLNCSLFDNTNVDETPLLDKNANAYLASLNNMDLFRVAQYFALYEIFKEYGISCPSYKRQPQMDKSYLMVDDARRALERLRNISDAEKDKIVFKAAEDEFDNLYLSGFNAAFERTKEQERQKWEQRFNAAVAQNAEAKKMTVAQYMQTPEYQSARNKFEQAYNAQMDALYSKSHQAAVLENTKDAERRIGKLLKVARDIPARDIDGFCRFSSCPHKDYNNHDLRRYQEYQHEIERSWGIWWYGPFLGIDYKGIMSNYRYKTRNDTTFWHKTPKVFTTNNQYGTTKGANGQYRAGTMLGGHSIRQNVQEEARQYTPPQPKRVVSHLLDEIEQESKLAEQYARSNHSSQAVDPRAIQHQRNAIQLMSGSLNGRPATQKSSAQVKFRGLAEEIRKVDRESVAQDRKDRKFKRERDHLLAMMETEQLQKKCNTMLRELTSTPEKREQNAQVISQLQRQKRFLDNVPNKYSAENIKQRAADKVNERKDELITLNEQFTKGKNNQTAEEKDKSQQDMLDAFQEDYEDAELRRLKQRLAELKETYERLTKANEETDENL